MRYVAKTTPDGYSFVFRNVLEFKFMAAEKFLSVQLEGKKLELHGITSFEGGGDFEPHLLDFKMIPPDEGGEKAESKSAGFEFPREEPVPAELATTTFSPLERLGADDSAVKRVEKAIRDSDLRFRSAVVSTIKDARKMGLVH